MTTNKIIKCYLGEGIFSKGIGYRKFKKQMPEIIFKESDTPEFADIILVGNIGFNMSVSKKKRRFIKIIL